MSAWMACFEARLQAIPVMYDVLLVLGHQSLNARLELRHQIDIWCCDHDLVAGALHVENILKQTERDLCDRPIKILDAAIEDSDDIDHGGRERPVQTASQ